MSFKFRSGMLLALLLLVFSVGASQASAALQTVTAVPFGGNINGPSAVYPSWTDSRTTTGWTSYVERDQSMAANHGFQFVTGPPGVPLGVDSAEVSNGPDTPAGGNKSYLVGPGGPLVGQPLSALTAYSYSALNHSSVSAYSSFEINPGPGTNKSFSGLTFDPSLNSPIAANAWNTFNALASPGTAITGKWWFTSTITLNSAVVLTDGSSSGLTVGGGGGPNIGSQDHPLTWANVLRILPNAKFILTGPALVVGQTGTGNGNSVDNFDNVTVGINGVSNTFNFERAVPTRLVADPIVLQFFPLRLTILTGLTAHLYTASGIPIPGMPVFFTEHGNFLCVGITNAFGTANCAPFLSLSQVLAILNLGYDANFLGAGAFQPSHAPGELTK